MSRPKSNNNTKQSIFLTAVDLFSKKGYDGTSIRDIAYTVGIKESSLYFHYKSKSDLLNSIFEYCDNWLNESKPTNEQIDELIKSLSPFEFFENFFLSISDRHDDISQKISLLIMNEQYRNEKARIFSLEKNCRQVAVFFEDILNRYKTAGCLPDTFDSNFFSHELNYYYLGMVTEWSHVKLRNEDDNYLKERLRKHLSFIFK
ncbi:MAG: TetR/AcrR family transcriptional regulator [Bacillota bacterium]|nr:TetR/AcrR family transcriptional regulator [Bacillota bacterium]